jgi:hypothetical protein
MSNKYKNPEHIKKALKQMLDRPERFDPASIVEEKDDSGKYSVENPEKPYSVPAQIKAGVKKVTEHKMDAPEVQHETDDSGEIKVQEPKELYHADPEITEMMRKLKSGESLQDEDQQQVEETIEDSSADKETRKQAIAKIKQKYLGR